MDVNMEWNVCRVCLQEADEMKSIFGEEDESEESPVSERIMQCSSIVVKKGMNLPEQICVKCLSDLEIAYRFRTNCESSAAVLNSILESAVVPPAPPEMSVSIGPGEVYKFRPPSGLKVSKLPTSTLKITTEIEPITIEEEEIIIPKQEMTEDDDFYVVDAVEYEDDPPIIVPDSNMEAYIEKEGGEGYEVVRLKTAGMPKRGRPKKEPQPIAENEEIVTTETLSDGRRLIRIKRLFDEPKPLKICEICGNTYKYQHALNSHMRRHRNEKPFTCEICSKGFVINFELSRHMRTHTGQKPYGCKYCDRKFSDFGSRIKHERTHTGERPYACETCGKTFAYSHVLSSHMLTHTGVKNYECSVCSKRFTKAHHLKAHRNTHERLQGRIIRSNPAKSTIHSNDNSTSKAAPEATPSTSSQPTERLYKDVMTILTARKPKKSSTQEKVNVKLEEGNVAAELIV